MNTLSTASSVRLGGRHNEAKGIPSGFHSPAAETHAGVDAYPETENLFPRD